MRVSAKADYAVRAAVELAAAAEGPVKGTVISKAQKIPLRFLENILGELRHAGIVQSQRGSEGGYWLARTADDITIAEIVRAVEGSLASVRGERPEDLDYLGGAEPLRQVWVALRANIRQILESVTLADGARGSPGSRPARSSCAGPRGRSRRPASPSGEGGSPFSGGSAETPPHRAPISVEISACISSRTTTATASRRKSACSSIGSLRRPRWLSFNRRVLSPRWPELRSGPVRLVTPLLPT